MRALVLSGGGSKGSWQAGAIKAVADSCWGKKGFDFISGTSVGAINAAGLGMFRKDEFRSAAIILEGIWYDRLKVWRLKFPWYLCGLWSPSIGTNKRLEKFIDKKLNLEDLQKSDVDLCFSAVDIESGELKRFTKDSNDIKAAIMASASFPVAFPLQEVERRLYTDGGVRDIAPLKPAIEAGASEIIVLMTENPFEAAEVEPPKNAVSMAMRVVNLLTAEVLLNDIERCYKINEQIIHHPGKRKVLVHTYWPEKPLADSLNFKTKLMRKQIEQGYDEVRKQLDDVSPLDKQRQAKRKGLS